jgi:hypothetical protein
VRQNQDFLYTVTIGKAHHGSSLHQRFSDSHPSDSRAYPGKIVITLQYNRYIPEIAHYMQQSSFNLESNNSEILIIQHLKRVVP